MKECLEAETDRKSYFARDGAIVGGAHERYNNRPIYSNNRDDVIIGGDFPIVRFGRNPFLFGTLMVGISRGPTSFWLHEANEIEMSYRAGRISWQVSDTRLPGLCIKLDVVPIVGFSGFVLRMGFAGQSKEDRVFWVFGGLVSPINPNAFFDAVTSPDVQKRAFEPNDALGNQVDIIEDRFLVKASAARTEDGSAGDYAARSVGAISVSSRLFVADACDCRDFSSLVGSKVKERPILGGCTELDQKPLYFGVLGCSGSESIDEGLLEHLSDLFNVGWRRGEELAARCVVRTPEPRLDALASASVAAIDGAWYPPCFVHSAMLWNMPFPGWRTIFGGTMYGWRDRLKETAEYFISSQLRDSDKTNAEADEDRLLTMQGEGSRFYGKGRITAHSAFYDMQSQLFDQLVTEWRWRTDQEFEDLLRPALNLHLEWLQECFDPNKTGTYESYINSWPTDSVWYNGGASCEATSYAYRGHQAAFEMAVRASDSVSEEFHAGALTRIREGFFKSLWIDRLGHPGKYREQGGHRRLHEDPWLYGIFLPVDAKLLSAEQAATALHYARSRLQNDEKPSGGRMVWNSNWVPAIWSTRTDWPGDNYALALAYYQAGFAEDGWEVFKGTFLTTAYDLSCPGNLGHKAGGYDFGDCSHTFSRALVEGLFGYNPDYPNGTVSLWPQMPHEWDEASISLPDLSLCLKRADAELSYKISLAVPAILEICIPLRVQKVLGVTVDGVRAPYLLESGINTSIVRLSLTRRSQADVVIYHSEAFSPPRPLELQGNVGDRISVSFDTAVILRVLDPQKIFECQQLNRGEFSGVLADNVGRHLVLAETKIGENPFTQLVHLKVNSPIQEAAMQGRLVSRPSMGSSWKFISLGEFLNGDVRSIFKQKYTSPRPNTVSLRIGTDGWTPWTSTFWKHSPPSITLSNVSKMIGDGALVTPQGAAFVWPDGEKNIAFTSLWDNYPDSVLVPLDDEGDELWLLIAGSTNPMQCNIANAEVRLRYSDGNTERLELIPPDNFWSLAPICISGAEKGQEGRHDYTDPLDKFCVRQPYPAQVELGENCRAMLYGLNLREGIRLSSITLEALSQEVVIGLMGVSIAKRPSR